MTKPTYITGSCAEVSGTGVAEYYTRKQYAVTLNYNNRNSDISSFVKKYNDEAKPVSGTITVPDGQSHIVTIAGFYETRTK